MLAILADDVRRYRGNSSRSCPDHDNVRHAGSGLITGKMPSFGLVVSRPESIGLCRFKATVWPPVLSTVKWCMSRYSTA